MSLPNINDYVAEIRAEYLRYGENKISKVESGYLALQLLAGEGIFLEATKYSVYDQEFDVTPLQLAVICRTLGRFENPPATRAVQDTRKHEIWKVWTPEDKLFSHLHFRIKMKLPKGSKCTIKVQKGKKERVLVCEA